MNSGATVSAADIARLVDVGRAAVSNWRRRFDDFPRPVGGSAASPLFSLTEIEDWLRRNGKAFEVSTAERTWQALRSGVDDLRLGEEVARAGMFLSGSGSFDDSQLARLLNQLAEEHGAAGAYELIVARYVDAHSRRLAVTPPAVAELMVRLACPDGGVVLDPACGVGTLAVASTAHEVFLQDIDRAAMVIASCRMTLRDTDVDMATGDSLRRDRFAGQLVDAVLCDPPVNDRTWGHEELVADPRWEYGVPPRGEPELAWLQHCLSHVGPDGMVAILMPPTAASRRPGRRIRAKLLRTGALRAVIGLPDAGSDLWLLCRPAPESRPPSTVLITDELDGVETAWLDPSAADAVRIIDCSTTTSTSARPGGGSWPRGRTSAASSPPPSSGSAASTSRRRT
ncbi:N-6 DNA methylase [Kutzneria sp. 744]|uniref:N-6 DNA methylase n=1 Tax=Kutzneria sp. (strain 744) TaxID=345341 RepID=UPI0003EEC809|nr:N-6 DNA methylase [Kutzneria sp. 744]